MPTETFGKTRLAIAGVTLTGHLLLRHQAADQHLLPHQHQLLHLHQHLQHLQLLLELLLPHKHLRHLK
jgi:hypothetical protein